MSKSEMRRKAGLTTNALAKLGKGESVPLETLEKICSALNCRIEDIVEYLPDDTEKKDKAN
jgi:DNA (cytosine-5)-methyltransferase 1